MALLFTQQPNAVADHAYRLHGDNDGDRGGLDRPSRTEARSNSFALEEIALK